MIDFLYVFRYDLEHVDNAIKRLICSIDSVWNQDVRIIVFNASDQDINPGISETLNKCSGSEYIYKPVKGQFNKSKLINYAVKNYVRTEYFLFSDIDLVYQEDYVVQMKKYVYIKGDFFRVVPYNYNIYRECYSSDFKELIALDKNNGGFAHGNGLIHKKSFMRIRGYYEEFIGYGPEDGCFNECIGCVNKLIYANDIVTAHLWHENFNRIQEQKNSDMYHKIQNDLRNFSKIEDLQYNDKDWGTLRGIL
jgi:predicted glycosyltransferase involved in capsule biosynthesis